MHNTIVNIIIFRIEPSEEFWELVLYKKRYRNY
jgi:hypothetical protein